MVFFKKKSKKKNITDLEELENINLDNQSEEKHNKTALSLPSSSANLSHLGSLYADVDKLKAQTEANNELRQMFSEKFSRIDEEIGELRTMLIDRERDMQSLEIKATKAVDLVSEVQPEKLMIEVKRQDVKNESLRSKLETFEQLNDSIMQELKNVRNSIRTFRGVKEIEKMTKEVLDYDVVIKKIHAEIEQDSDKVETIFLEFNKKFEEFRHFKQLADDLNESFKNIVADTENLKVKFSELVEQDKFDEFKNKVMKLISSFKSDEDKFGKFLKEFDRLRTNFENVVDTYKEFQKDRKMDKVELKSAMSDILKSLETKLAMRDKSIENVRGKLDSKIKIIDTINKKMMVMSGQLTKKIDKTLTVKKDQIKLKSEIRKLSVQMSKLNKTNVKLEKEITRLKQNKNKVLKQKNKPKLKKRKS